MNEIRLNIQVGRDDGIADVFLCHNRKDAAVVEEVANALELESGVRFFLDRLSIPVGSEFLSYIEEALAKAKGCAIFLGRNGWGPTQFWEAEQALARYQRDPDFRLIPVVLPGASEDDMSRLGSGSVFNKINRSDLTAARPKQDEYQALAAAISGEAAPQLRSPARLNPYQLRRDTARWRVARETSARNGRDILYRGSELEEAKGILAANPDFAVVAEVQPFIAASEEAQRSFWRRVATAATLVALVLAVLSSIAFYSARVADNRRLESLSRALAIQASRDAAPDRQLLIALEAFSRAETAEAEGAVLTILDRWHPLIASQRLSAGITATGPGVAGNSLLVATSSGQLFRLWQDGSLQQLAETERYVTALGETADHVLIGGIDGRVTAVSKHGERQTLVYGHGRQSYIREIVATVDGSLIAVGDHMGRVHILRPEKADLTLNPADGAHVTALAISPDSRTLAVATADHRLTFYPSDTFQSQYTWRTNGAVETIAFGADRQVIWVTAFGQVEEAQLEDDGPRILGSNRFPGVISQSSINPSAGVILIGEANGFMRAVDVNGSDVGFGRIAAHADTVAGMVVAADGTTILSADAAGHLSAWSLDPGRGFGVELPKLRLGPVALAIDASQHLLAATRDRETAAVWRLNGNDWEKVLDLVELSANALGPEDAAPLVSKIDDDGFEDISTTFVDEVSLTEFGVLWSLWNGALLWKPFGNDHTVVLSGADGKTYSDLAIGAAGTILAASLLDTNKVDVFNASDGMPFAHLTTPANIDTIGFDPSGKRLALGLADGRVIVKTIRSKSYSTLPAQHASPVAEVLFVSQDTVASLGTGGSSDRNLILQDLSEQSNVIRIEAQKPTGSASAASASATLDTIVVGDLYRNVHIFRASRGKFVHSMNLAGTYISAVVLDEAHLRVIAADGGGAAVHAWPLDPDVWTSMICKKAGRSLRADEWRELMPNDAYTPQCRQ